MTIAAVDPSGDAVVAYIHPGGHAFQIGIAAPVMQPVFGRRRNDHHFGTHFLKTADLLKCLFANERGQHLGGKALAQTIEFFHRHLTEKITKHDLFGAVIGNQLQFVADEHRRVNCKTKIKRKATLAVPDELEQ